MEFGDIEFCDKEICDAQRILAYLKLQAQVASVIYDTMEETTKKTSTTLRVLNDFRNLLSKTKVEYLSLSEPVDMSKTPSAPPECLEPEPEKPERIEQHPHINCEPLTTQGGSKASHSVNARIKKSSARDLDPLRRRTMQTRYQSARPVRPSRASTRSSQNLRTPHNSANAPRILNNGSAAPPRRIKHNRNYPKPWLDPPPPPPAAPRTAIEPPPKETNSTSPQFRDDRRASINPAYSQRKPRSSIASLQQPQRFQRRASFALPVTATQLTATQTNRARSAQTYRRRSSIALGFAPPSRLSVRSQLSRQITSRLDRITED